MNATVPAPITTLSGRPKSHEQARGLSLASNTAFTEDCFLSVGHDFIGDGPANLQGCVYKALNRMRIFPMDNVLTEARMAEKLQVANEAGERQLSIAKQEKGLHKKLVAFWLKIFIASVILTSCFAITILLNLPNKLIWATYASIAPGTLTVVSMIRILMLGLSMPKIPHVEIYSWKKTHIARYNKNIPENILRMLIRLKFAIPAADIYIHELATDPMVSFELGGETYYVASWD